MIAYGRLAQFRRPNAVRVLFGARLSFVFCGALPALFACSVKQSRLLTHKSGSASLAVSDAGPVTPAVAATIDERPIGGASLNGGTNGGGTYLDAYNGGQLFYADNEGAIRDLIGDPEPRVILIAEGSYDFGTTAARVVTCTQACSPTTPVAQMTTNNCAADASTFETPDTEEYLRFGPNKTLIGLGKGATFNNAELSLSHVSNVILRNLTIQNVAPNIAGQGWGINLWPGDHVWVDHCTFRNIGRGYVNIRTSQEDPNNAELITTITGYVTLTHNIFDGKVDGICDQRAQTVVATNRNPALTFAYNWFNRSYNRNPFLMGPETWAHVFNNYWTDVNYAGLAAACSAVALLQGNTFESTNSAISINDNGVDSTLCASSPWGRVYAPMNTGTDEDNVLDSSSTVTLHNQPTDGTGLMNPSRVSGHRFNLTVPTDPGSTETYEITLQADPMTIAEQVKATAGAGNLF